MEYKNLVKVINLTKKFKGLKAIDNLSFSAKRGEIFGLLGPNGAGKTTTLRVISSVLQPTSGTAEVCGFDVKENSQEVRKNIGILTTEIGVYDRFTGRENLEYFGNLYGLQGKILSERIDKLAKLLDMKGFLERKSGNYSTGMKQKLAIARAIIHDPPVIILDEPTTGLDVLASLTVMSFMERERKAGKCVILSTHRMNDAEKLCDRVAILHKGKLLDIDTVKDINLKAGTDDLETAFLRLVHKKV